MHAVLFEKATCDWEHIQLALGSEGEPHIIGPGVGPGNRQNGLKSHMAGGSVGDDGLVGPTGKGQKGEQCPSMPSGHSSDTIGTIGSPAMIDEHHLSQSPHRHPMNRMLRSWIVDEKRRGSRRRGIPERQSVRAGGPSLRGTFH